LRSPKLTGIHESDWYRYYAGYAPGFVEDALASLDLDDGATVLDPWNGSGTTTAIVHEQGFAALGYDANPALVLIARARLLGADVADSLDALAEDILDHASAFSGELPPESDPLEDWLQLGSAHEARMVERAIQHVLVAHEEYTPLSDSPALGAVSALAAFFYVALFDALRAALRPFVASNPTWVKTAMPEDRLTLTPQELHGSFRAAVVTLRGQLREYGQPGEAVAVELATSQRLPAGTNSATAAITSPPYCTRIDYVAATRPELAVLGYGKDQIRALRVSMVGTPTIATSTPQVVPEWGLSATSLIESISTHSSHASGTYYRKYFVQYFDALWKSLKELRRVVRPEGPAVIVVQDSYYKELHIDLPRIVHEMADGLGWSATCREDFAIGRTKAAIHPGARSWRSSFSATESVLLFS
jgi:SAM-dependent methyltransferase